ncbi:cation:proton antiporter [Anaerosacchariphilus polymeriproducens]|uniref:Sodium:proton antiporter n=1 Tax=Anaerosacchariphilus polymeriproducens TaxID=1812858 RepID=A0A371AWT4_9FIRM|nr:cation:proton antiporter [Anaerosacchariphilus polymeriproducens]RDU24038.1 sodium:proton antiporter [Anaerosacchariphilus polymeriproducens]
MLTSLALIFLLGLILGSIFQKLKLPSLLGMIITGIILSPNALNLLDVSLIEIAPSLRQLALVIILTRAGLSLDIEDLKKVGRPAILMCFVPACFEILGVILIAPKLLGISVLEAAILGSVIAAVSPAVIVPKMLKIMEEGYGKKHSIPQLVLAGASVDDVFVIVIFTAFISLAKGEDISAMNFVQIPISIVIGILLGIITGAILSLFFKRFHMRDSVKVIIILSISFLFLECENQLKGFLPMSGLLAIMSMGVFLNQSYNILAKRLSAKYNRLWVAAEVLLFVLVGVTVDLRYVKEAGIWAVLTIVLALVIRMAGVFVSLLKSGLPKNEKLFCMLAYTPKATVQAAIAGIPLSLNLSCGKIVLTVAVIAILITAPFGAICVDKSYKKLLENNRLKD